MVCFNGQQAEFHFDCFVICVIQSGLSATPSRMVEPTPPKRDLSATLASFSQASPLAAIS